MASEHTWAAVGKGLTAATAVVGLLVGLIQIADALSGPDIIAIVEQRENVLPPKFRDELATNISRDEIKKLIEDREKKKESSDKILRAVKDRTAKQDDLSSALLGFDSLFHSTAWHVTILNKSDEVAKDVRVLFPGSGKADVIEGRIGHFDVDKKPIEWKKEIAIGSVPPRGTVQLLVWPEEGFAATLFGAEVGLLHDGGSGVVRRWQKFYGWDSDLAAWFLGQSVVFRWTVAVATVLVLGMAMWQAKKRGYLVLRPHRAQIPDELLKDVTGSGQAAPPVNRS